MLVCTAITTDLVVRVAFWAITIHQRPLVRSAKFRAPSFDGLHKPISEHLSDALIQHTDPGIEVAVILQVEVIDCLLDLAQKGREGLGRKFACTELFDVPGNIIRILDQRCRLVLQMSARLLAMTYL